MRAVGRANTKPETIVRSILHRLGLRFRLHLKNLPGTPDIVLRRHKTAIFVHGCFWHRHPNCRYATTPKTRTEFWLPKFKSNIERDARKKAELEKLGWRVLIVWECETRSPEILAARLAKEFGVTYIPSSA
jgi:DNA mismatch endonuclease, patch repair protein